MMWARSSGIPYFFARYFTSVAEFSYIASVNQAPLPALPSCSTPIACMLMYQLPACQPTSFGFKCCAMWPSLERTV